MFNGRTRGIKKAMYSYNKQKQGKEYKILSAIAEVKEVEIDLPDPLNTRISVKRWDEKYLYPAIYKLGFTDSTYRDLLKYLEII